MLVSGSNGAGYRKSSFLVAPAKSLEVSGMSNVSGSCGGWGFQNSHFLVFNEI